MIKFITVLYRKHKKHLPKKMEGTVISELLKYGICIFLSAWILQGIRYMNWRESLIKVLIDILLTLLLTLSGIHIVISIIIAHTLNFAFNGQLYAMYTHMGATTVTPEKFLNNTISIASRLGKKSFISAAIAYGSLSRGLYKRTSDIDIRFVPAKGRINYWKTCFYAINERIIAFVNQYPLDLYVFDENTLLRKMKTDEMPIMIYEKDNCMSKTYPERVELKEFITIFKISNCNESI